MVRLSDVAIGHDNNFQLVRLVMALVVTAAHSINVFTNSRIAEDAVGSNIYMAATIALDAFFVFSGFLVTASLSRRQDPVEYVVARALRILPALIVVSLACAYLMGPLVTSLPLAEYFTDPATHIYAPVTSLTTHPDLLLPGVFMQFIDPGVVNAPIWTLRYEILLYGGLLLLFMIGLLGRTAILLVTAIWGLAFAFKLAFVGAHSGTAFVDHMSHFGFAFLIGACSWMCRDVIRLNGWIAIAGLVVLALIAETIWVHPVGILTVPYLIFWLGYVPNGRIRAYNKLGDFSYGVYIIHWPVLSTLLVFWPDLTPLPLFVTTVPITILLSIACWYLVEAPALRQIKPITNLAHNLPGLGKIQRMRRA